MSLAQHRPAALPQPLQLVEVQSPPSGVAGGGAAPDIHRSLPSRRGNAADWLLWVAARLEVAAAACLVVSELWNQGNFSAEGRT